MGIDANYELFLKTDNYNVSEGGTTGSTGKSNKPIFGNNGDSGTIGDGFVKEGASEADPGDTESCAEVKYTYHPNGKKKSESKFDAKGNEVETIEYDENEKQIKRIVREFNDNKKLTKLITYDASDAVQEYETFEYDENNNLVKSSKFDSNKRKLSSCEYSVNSAGETVKTKEIMYNNKGEWTEESEFNPETGMIKQTKYKRYDLRDYDASLGEATIIYNEQGQKTKMNFSRNGEQYHVDYKYNDGVLSSESVYKGLAHYLYGYNYDYDKDGNMTGKHGSIYYAPSNHTYKYDSYGNMVSESVDRKSGGTATHSDITYKYNEMGQVVEETSSYKDANGETGVVTTTYEYDSDTHKMIRKTMTRNNGQAEIVNEYLYDRNTGFLLEDTYTVGESVTKNVYERYENGDIKRLVRTINGVQNLEELYTYDDLNTCIYTCKKYGSNGVVKNYDIVYKNGAPSKVVVRNSNGSEQYYDAVSPDGRTYRYTPERDRKGVIIRYRQEYIDCLRVRDADIPNVRY